MASYEIWEFYGKPSKETETAKDKKPKQEVKYKFQMCCCSYICGLGQ